MMREKVNYEYLDISIGEILYGIFFGTLLFAKGIGLYDGQGAFKVILVFAMCFLVIKIAIEKHTTEEFLKIFCVITLTAITYLVSGEKGMMLYGMMMVGMKHVDVKRVFTLGTILWAVAFLGITVTSLFHMSDTVYKVHEKLGLGHIFRWSLGYPHPNVLQVSYFVFAVFFVYVLDDNFKVKHALWLFAGNCLIFLFSISYTGVILFMCLIIGRVYLLFRKKLCFLEKWLLQLVFPLCILVSLLVPIMMDVKGEGFQLLNEIFNQRVELGWLYLREENISLWGQRLSEIISSSKTMDNAYLFAFITYGIIPFTILCMATMYMIYKYLKEDRYLEILIILSIVIGGITEPFLYNTSFKNLSFIFMGTLLFGNKKGKKEWSLIPGQGILISERKIKVKVYGKKIIKEKFAFMVQPKWKKCLAGAIGAVFLCLIVNLFISYPEGYVVYRANCSGISENKKYYDENNAEYKDFKKMHSFKDGDEIEYFSGNIVLMEKIRNSVVSIILGFGMGYLLVEGIDWYQERKQNEKYRQGRLV